jgi:hypothetical protein
MRAHTLTRVRVRTHTRHKSASSELEGVSVHLMACTCSFGYSFGLQLLLPALPFVLSILSAGMAWVWSKLIRRHHILGVTLGFMCKTTDEVKEYLLDWCARVSLLLFTVKFLPMLFSDRSQVRVFASIPEHHVQWDLHQDVPSLFLLPAARWDRKADCSAGDNVLE